MTVLMPSRIETGIRYILLVYNYKKYTLVARLRLKEQSYAEVLQSNPIAGLQWLTLVILSGRRITSFQ